jgi:murein DD-endopeptidase MepM/ murein hydrolase activator NlpD
LSKHIFKTAKQFPKVHLALAGTLTAVGVFVAALLPSQEVEATRSQVQLITPTITAEAVAPEARTESSTSELVAKVDPDSEVAPASNTELDSAAAAPKIDEIKWSKFEVRSGDNLTKIFKRAGLTPRHVHQVSQSDKDKLLTRIRPGQFLELALNNEGGLDRLRLVKSKLESVIFVHNGDGYDLETVERTPELRTHFVSGDIQNSLYLGAQRAGLSDSKIMELAQIFGWDIDFALDIRKGDQFRVLYEEKYLDGEKIGEGNILAAEFTNNGDTFAAVRYTDSNGDTNYYTPDGRSMRKAFLRSPVDFRRISSGFKRERYHPVLGVKRPHRGTDYAAKTGTPIKASGDGKVIWRGTKGGYGKTIIIQHGGNITTLYAHMSKYNSKVTSGSRVKQGQTIGYVGMTGTATGPHLHYEFRLNGVHKNPVTVKLPDAQPIANKELAKFKADTSQLIAELQMKAVEQLADASLNSNNDG